MALSVYLAGRYRWAAQIESVARRLRELPDVKIISEWHRWDPPKWMTLEQVVAFERKRDTEGVRACNIFVFFRKPPARSVKLNPNELVRGGRFIELGMAMALKKEIIVFGGVSMDGLSIFEMDENIPIFSVMRDLVGQIDCIAEVS